MASEAASPPSTKKRTASSGLQAAQEVEEAESASKRRKVLSSFVDTATIAQLLESKPPRPLVTLPHDSTVQDALTALAEAKILSAPVELASSVVDRDEGQFLGVVSTQQFVHELMKETHGNYSQLDKAGHALLERKLITVCSERDVGVVGSFEETATLRELLQVFCQSARPVHRIAVLDAEGAVAGVVSQTDVVRFLHANRALLGELADKRLSELEDLGTVEVVTVPQHWEAAEAFRVLDERGVTGLALVDDDGAIQGNVSSSDLRGLVRGSFSRLQLPARSFITTEVITCRVDETLGGVLDTFAERGIHRIYVVNDARVPVRVITLSDVLAFFQKEVGHAPPPSADAAAAADEETNGQEE